MNTNPRFTDAETEELPRELIELGQKIAKVAVSHGSCSVQEPVCGGFTGYLVSP